MSINCLNVFICIQLTAKKKVDLWKYLYFLLNKCMDNNRTPILKKILKTIVFINKQLSIWATAVYF